MTRPFGAAPLRATPTSPLVLGDPGFARHHGTHAAFMAGAMGKGIAGEDWVVRLARAGLLGAFGAGGLTIERIRDAVRTIQAALPPAAPFAINVLHNPLVPAQEDALIDLLLAEEVRCVEASAFITPTPALVRYRLAGLRAGPDGAPLATNRLIAKVSRPEVARHFLAPADPAIVAALHQAGRIGAEAARLAAHVPLADDLTAEADSGGHTDRRVAYTQLPHFCRLRDEIAAATGLAQRVRIGAAGGIGTPDAALAAYALGADYIVTGSINQATPEAATSATVKDMLATAELADFDIAPAGDMFELGAKVQVLRRGTLFPGRANRLYEIWRTHAGLDDIPPATLAEIESRYFGRTVAEVWAETAHHYRRVAPQELAEAEANSRKRLAMVLRWYFIHASRLAIEGRPEARINYQVWAGPAVGAANRWLKGTDLEPWQARHVDTLSQRLIDETAALAAARIARWRGADQPGLAAVTNT